MFEKIQIAPRKNADHSKTKTTSNLSLRKNMTRTKVSYQNVYILLVT